MRQSFSYFKNPKTKSPIFSKNIVVLRTNLEHNLDNLKSEGARQMSAKEIMQGYMAGINLGGWISQYGDHGTKEHFDTFIQESDLEKIKDWGADHIRLPVDYPVFWNPDTETGGEIISDGFKYITWCIETCANIGLNVMLDLHAAPGFRFYDSTSSLFTSAPLQDDFVYLWQTLAKALLDYRNVRFDILNEVRANDPLVWNNLAKRVVDTINEIDPERYILVGGLHYNSINELKRIERFNSDKVIYNFHFYLPMIFTHQKASWNPDQALFNRQVTYPDSLDAFYAYKLMLEENPHINGESTEVPGLELGIKSLDKEMIRVLFQPALDFAKETGLPVYCGEYGVIDHADIDSRWRWTMDVANLCLEAGIGRAVWSYKGMNFSLVDELGEPLHEKLIEAVVKK